MKPILTIFLFAFLLITSSQKVIGQDEQIPTDSASSTANLSAYANDSTVIKEPAVEETPELDMFANDRKRKRSNKEEKSQKDEIQYYQGLSEIYRSPVRKILNMFSVNLSTGAGLTRYKYSLEGIALYDQSFPSQYYVNPDDPDRTQTTFSGYVDWFNQPTIYDEERSDNLFPIGAPNLENPVNNPSIGTQTTVYEDLEGFRSFSYGFPIRLSLHFNYKKFRIGGGLEYEFHRIRPFNSLDNSEVIRSYRPNIKGATYRRTFGYLGYQFYKYYRYTFVGEFTLGKVKTPNKKFNNTLIKHSLLYNVGLSVEKNLSEYFRITFKPSVEFNNYTIQLPNSAEAIQFNNPSFFMHVGISVNFPEIPRSPIPADHTQVKHVITDQKTGRRAEVRGQPIWKEQNPKVGQNHRQLIKYKGKNKRKLNPY